MVIHVNILNYYKDLSLKVLNIQRMMTILQCFSDKHLGLLMRRLIIFIQKLLISALFVFCSIFSIYSYAGGYKPNAFAEPIHLALKIKEGVHNGQARFIDVSREDIAAQKPTDSASATAIETEHFLNLTWFIQGFGIDGNISAAKITKPATTTTKPYKPYEDIDEFKMLASEDESDKDTGKGKGKGKGKEKGKGKGKGKNKETPPVATAETTAAAATATATTEVPVKKPTPTYPLITDTCIIPTLLAHPRSKYRFSKSDGFQEVMPMLTIIRLFLIKEITPDVLKKQTKLIIPNKREFTLDFDNGDSLTIYVPAKFDKEFRVEFKKKPTRCGAAEQTAKNVWHVEWEPEQASYLRPKFITAAMMGDEFYTDAKQ